MPKVGACGPEQVQAVGLGLGKSLLVTVNYAVRVVVEPSCRDKALPDHFLPTRRGEFLGITVDRRFRISYQNAVPAPAGKEIGRAGVQIVGGRFRGSTLA